MTIGNLTQLAERLNVSKTRISQIKQKGILNGIMKKQRSGAFLLDIETAVKIIKENAEPYGRGHTIKIIPTALSPSETTPKEQTFSYFRDQKENYAAMLAKLDLDVRRGVLLNAEDVKQSAFEMYRQTRDSLLNIVDRISSQLSSESNEDNIRKILETEIINALSHLHEGTSWK